MSSSRPTKRHLVAWFEALIFTRYHVQIEGGEDFIEVFAAIVNRVNAIDQQVKSPRASKRAAGCRLGSKGQSQRRR